MSDYTPQSSEDLQRFLINNEWTNKEAEEKFHGRCVLYEPQKEASTKAVEAFMSKQVVLCFAQPQSGKSGYMLYLAYLMATHPSSLFIKASNIFIFTGMNDVDWKNQIKDDMLPKFKENVYHLGDLKKLQRAIQNIPAGEKCLIMWDECHIAAGKGQKMSRMLPFLKDPSEMRRRNIYCVAVSATPSFIQQHMKEKWSDEDYEITTLETVPGYVGIGRMYNEGRIRDPINIGHEPDVIGLIQTIKESFNSPKYHIIRKPPRVSEFLLKEYVRREGWTFQSYVAEDPQNPTEFNEMIGIAPSNQTFILIKNRFRAGKRLKDLHIGCLVEPETLDDTVKVQGLLGRMCGYGKQCSHGAPIIFGNYRKTMKNYYDFLKYGGYDQEDQEYTDAKLKKKARSSTVATRPSLIGEGQRHQNGAGTGIGVYVGFIPVDGPVPITSDLFEPYRTRIKGLIHQYNLPSTTMRLKFRNPFMESNRQREMEQWDYYPGSIERTGFSRVTFDQVENARSAVATGSTFYRSTVCYKDGLLGIGVRIRIQQ